MLARIFITLSLFIAFTVLAYQPQLSDTQCARFVNEYKKLEASLGVAQDQELASMSNRYGRLQERINVFCPKFAHEIQQNDTAQIAEEEQFEEPAVPPLYIEPEKQVAWESFYSEPEHCLSASISEADLSRCQQEKAQFQHVFEQQWVQNMGGTSEQSEEIHPISNNESISSDSEKVEPVKKPVTTPKKVIEPIVINDFTVEQTSGLDTLWAYVEDYIFIILLLLSLLLGSRFILPLLKKLLTKHYSEVMVDRYLAKHLEVSDYRLYGKVTLPISGGETTIDELIVSKFGVFVISCQSQLGKIYADTTSDVWTEQVGKKQNHFANPIMQFPSKVQGIKNLFEIQENVHAIAVFDQTADFRTKLPQDVCQMGQLLKYVTRHQDVVFTQEQMEHFGLLLSEYKTSNPFSELVSKLKKNQTESEWGV